MASKRARALLSRAQWLLVRVNSARAVFSSAVEYAPVIPKQYTTALIVWRSNCCNRLQLLLIIYYLLFITYSYLLLLITTYYLVPISHCLLNVIIRLSNY